MMRSEALNHAWLGSVWPSVVGFGPRSSGFSAGLAQLAMLEVLFLPDCVAGRVFKEKKMAPN